LIRNIGKETVFFENLTGNIENKTIRIPHNIYLIVDEKPLLISGCFFYGKGINYI
jgi:hypothetical protein